MSGRATAYKSKSFEQMKAARAKRQVAKAKRATAARGMLMLQRRAKSANAMRAIARAVVNASRELKYFKTISDASLSNIIPIQSGNAAMTQKDVCAVGFSTTVNVLPGTTTQVQYPTGLPIRSMTMTDTFSREENHADPTSQSYYRSQAPDGNRLTPAFATSCFHIARLAVNNSVPAQITPVAAGWDQVQGNCDVGAKALDCVPIMCRVVRVTEKTAPGVQNVNNPGTDLFINQWGAEYGVDVPGFTRNDCEFASINRHKYTVLNDSKFTLDPPLVVNHQIGVGASSASSGHDMMSRPLITGTPSDKTTRSIKFSHQLTIKKGGSLFYETPDVLANNNATAGVRREYVFFHFINRNIQGLTDADGGAGHTAPIGQLRVSVTPKAAFRD